MILLRLLQYTVVLVLVLCAVVCADAQLTGRYKPRTSPEPPPCGDESLRPTIPEPNQIPTYDFVPVEICDTDDSVACTVENVFALLIETPAAIGPAKDPENQRVTDCGVITLESFTNTIKLEKYEKAEDDNYIRVDIDEEHHRIINYTMPGHVFWPGQVIRRIVAYDGKVGVQTTGYGKENVVKKWGLNLFSSGPVWSLANAALRKAFAAMPSRTAQKFPRNELHDGTYRAREANRPMHGATLIFRKRGDHVVGIHSTPDGTNCYQGTITPTEIHVGVNVVRRHEDFATKAVSFQPILENDRDNFAPLQFIASSVEPFPNPRSVVGTPQLLERYTIWLNECSRNFGLPEKEPPPCGDSALQDAPLSCDTRSEYFRSEVACRASKTCTAANVFAVMLKTPNAIVLTSGKGAEAQDCGTLSVRVPGGEGRVRTEFDTKHNIIRIYALPGHPFFPSTMFRYVVDVGGRVDVNTEACGPDSVLAKMFADTAAAYVWKGPNKALKDALSGKP